MASKADPAVSQGVLILVVLPILVHEMGGSDVQAVLSLVALLTAVWAHELGHAGAARICRRPIIRIRIGCGPLLAQFGRVEIHLLPTDGATTYVRPARRGHAVLTTAAGPAANLLAAALLATLLGSALGAATLPFVLTNVAVGIGNVIPYTLKSNAGGSDGMRILRNLRRPPTTLTSIGPAAEARKARRIAAALVDQGRPEDARQLLDRDR